MKHFKMKAGMLAAAFAFAGFGVAMLEDGFSVSASQATVGGFYMENGAAVSVNDDFSGIRWTTTVEKGFAVDGKTVSHFGAIVAPTAAIDGELTHETELGGKNLMDIPVDSTLDTSAADVTYHTVVNYDDIVADYKEANPETTKTDAEILALAYKMELTARAYVAFDDGTYAYADVSNINTSRSARQVANVSALNGDTFNGDTDKTEKRDSYMVGNEYRKTTPDGERSAVVDMSNPTFAVTASITDLDDVGENYEVVIGANRVAATVSDSTVTITDASYSFEGETWLSVITENGDIYSTPIIAASKVINQATDLSVFNVADATDLKDGYYVLGGDIVVGGEYENNHEASIPTNKIEDEYGLSGTFNGMGYTVSDMTLAPNGLFGVINGGTVKNVAFKDVSFVENTTYTYGLASVVQNATFENVYLQVNDLGGVGKVTAVGFASIWDSTLKNCIFECPAADRDQTQTYGSFTAYPNNMKNVTFEDTYVISPAKMGHRSKDNVTNSVIDASDLEGVTRYNDAMEFINDKANNDYSSFNATCWNTTGEFPVWNGQPAYKVVEGMFSAKDGLLINKNGSEDVSLKTVFGENAVVTQNGETLSWDGDALTGVKPALIREDGYTTDVGYVTLQATADDEITNYLVKAYTLVLDNANDLSFFQMEFNGGRNYMTEEQAAANKFDGYYILANNVDGIIDSYATTKDTRHNGAFKEADGARVEVAGYGTVGTQAITTEAGGESLGTIKEFGLIGTFDGNGYEISNMYVGFDGIFGLIGSYGTIKNVAFKGITVADRYSVALAGFVCDNAKLTNVYLGASYPEDSPSNKANRLMFGQARSTVVLENCIIQAEENGTTGTAVHGVIGKMDAAPTWANVYVISNLEVSWADSSTIYDAANISGAANTIAGCERYETFADMPTTEGKYDDLVATGYFKLDDNGRPVWNSK